MLSSIVERILVEKAHREGPDAVAILRYLQISADSHFHDMSTRVVIEYSHPEQGYFVLYGFSIDDNDLRKDEAHVTKVLSVAMQGNLSLVGQMHFVRLQKYFPKAIRDVAVLFDEKLHQKIIQVQFKNGHVAEAPEAEAKTDLFLAKCSMLFDLPPL